MNPFKIKTIEEFTIDDCDTYISRYPYGEHIIEVRKRLKRLKLEQRVEPRMETGYDSDRECIHEQLISSPSNGLTDLSSVEVPQTTSMVDESPVDTSLPKSSYSDGDGLWWRIFLTVLIIGGLIALIIGTAGIGTPVAIGAAMGIRNVWKDYNF